MQLYSNNKIHKKFVLIKFTSTKFTSLSINPKFESLGLFMRLWGTLGLQFEDREHRKVP